MVRTISDTSSQPAIGEVKELFERYSEDDVVCVSMTAVCPERTTALLPPQNCAIIVPGSPS